MLGLARQRSAGAFVAERVAVRLAGLRRSQFMKNTSVDPAGAEFPARPLGKITVSFAKAFKAWKISLPKDDVDSRRRGRIMKSGWAIWYLFDSDRKGEYLDYYASHRMTNDRHVRIYSNGDIEELPAIGEFRLNSQDPKEDARLEAEYYAENQRVAEMLAAKGFGLQGDEPGGVQINRFLHLQKPDE
jgi:hypothetical protein